MVVIHVEVPMFLLSLTSMISEPVLVNLLIYKTCYVTMAYNQSECLMLGTENATIEEMIELEKAVQPTANLIGMTLQLLNAVVSTVICLFLGPWSDKHGRRPLMLFTNCGFAINFLIIALICNIPKASPWWLLLSSLASFCGGISTFQSVCFSYISDVSSKEDRGLRMGLMEASMTAGMLIGLGSTSYLYHAVGYSYVFLICAGLVGLSILHTFLVIKESKKKQNELVESTTTTNPFTWKTAKALVTTVFKRRNGYGRTILVCSISMLTLFVMASSDNSLLFLYVRQKLGWTLTKYSLFSGITNGIGVPGTLFWVYLIHKKLKCPEDSLIMGGLAISLNSSLLYAFATNDRFIYAGGILRSFGGASTAMTRSIISKVTSKNEAGKVFALTSAVLTVSGFISSPMYTWVYNVTLNSYSGAYNLCSAGFFGLSLILIMGVTVVKKKQGGFGTQEDDVKEKQEGQKNELI